MTVKVDGGGSTFIEGLHPGDVIGHPDSAEWRAIPPFDSVALLRSMYVKESASVLDSTVAADTTWCAEEDTIIVRYIRYACICPDHDLLDTTRFPGIKGFYVEPASASVEIPWRMGVSGNMFELIGRRSRHLYAASEAMGPPMPGYGFRYRSYRILHPYRAWGPQELRPYLDAGGSVRFWGSSLVFDVE